MQGLTLVDCSERLGVCRATGAFHLKNLFRKTGTQRQIELLSILFRSVGWGIGGRKDPAESEKKPAGEREGIKPVRALGSAYVPASNLSEI